MTSNGRRSTVYDVAALRIHPDGTRAGASRREEQTKQIKDVRGNVLALDAAGKMHVPRRPRLSNPREEDEEGETAVLESPGPSGKRKNVTPVKDYRAMKRRRFTETEFDFLSSPGQEPILDGQFFSLYRRKWVC